MCNKSLGKKEMFWFSYNEQRINEPRDLNKSIRLLVNEIFTWLYRNIITTAPTKSGTDYSKKSLESYSRDVAQMKTDMLNHHTIHRI